MGFFSDLMVGFEDIIAEMREIYLADSRPWAVLWSTGKDSTLTLCLTWEMLLSLPEESRTKTVHVITSDTKVEEPKFADFVNRSIEQVMQAAAEQNLPIEMHFTEPTIKDSFWFQVIGRGNCPPTEKSQFRWCTDKLKIKPVDRVVMDIIEQTPTSELLTEDAFDILMVLGVREEESENRRRSIQKFATEDKFARHAKFDNIKVYHPIKFVTKDDLWAYLLQKGILPWGTDAHDLYNLYAEFSKECPMTDSDGKQHASCGGGRQGCVVCCVAGKKDQMLISLIEHGDDSLIPMLEFKAMMYDMRLDVRYREPLRRINEMRIVPSEAELAQTSLFEDNTYETFDRADNWRYEPGPITIEGRRILLQKLLYVEKASGVQYIKPEELQAILETWEEDGYTATEEDLQPVNHQADGAVLFKKDGTLNEKTSTNRHPIFYVRYLFQEGAGEIVRKLKALSLRSGKHYFYAMSCIDPRKETGIDIDVPIVNAVEFVVCQKGVASQKQAEQVIRTWMQQCTQLRPVTTNEYFSMVNDGGIASGCPAEVLERVARGLIEAEQGAVVETA